MNVDEKFGFNDDVSRTDVKSTQKDEGIHKQILYVKCVINNIFNFRVVPHLHNAILS